MRRAVLLAAAVALGACGGAATEHTVPAAAPAPGPTGSGTGAGAGKLSAPLQQQVAAPALAYSGGAPSRADGRIEVTFHATRTIGTAEQDSLRALGAEIVTTLPADAAVPATAGVIVAWIAPDKVLTAAAADWVAAVTPAGTSVPR